jgi:hypothetical protein
MKNETRPKNRQSIITIKESTAKIKVPKIFEDLFRSE